MNIQVDPQGKNGLAWVLSSGFLGACDWILNHIHAIDDVLHLLIMLLTLYGLIVGLRKVRRKDFL